MRGTFGRSGSDWSTKRVGALLAGTGCAAGLVLAAAPAANALPLGCLQAAETVTCTYSATGSEQTFTPPTGITTVTVTLSGGSGGTGLTVGPITGGSGGAGATVSGTLTGVTGSLNVWAGEQGANASAHLASTGGTGYGSGGNGLQALSGGGGGGSAILNGTTALVVAGGGGGGGSIGTAANGGAGGAGGVAGSHGAGGIGTAGSGGATGSAIGTNGSTGGTGILLPPGGGGGGGNLGGAGGHAGVFIPSVGGGGGGGGANLLAAGTTVMGTATTANGSVAISYTLPALAITTTSLPGASVGVAYSATLNATGATPPYNWAVTAGSLPAGLSLDPTTGVISGTPTRAGNYSFTVQATDSATPPSSVSVTLSIAVGPVVSSVSPNWSLPGGGGITRINGAGLDCWGCHVSVKFGNAHATVLFATPTQLIVDSPPGHGTVNVTVTVNGVTSAITSADRYTYY
jgi:Putative Ig domain/IPT/TIG domain